MWGTSIVQAQNINSLRSIEGARFFFLFKIFSGRKTERMKIWIVSTNGFEKEISEKLGEAACIDKSKRISCSIGITTAINIRSEEDLNAMIKRADLLTKHPERVKEDVKICSEAIREVLDGEVEFSLGDE